MQTMSEPDSRAAPRFIYITPAAARLGISEKTLRGYVNARKLPERRHPVNNRLIFLPDEIDALLAGTAVQG